MIDNGTLQGFIFHNHYADVDAIKGDQMVVLRDPYDRFCSAFYYKKTYYPKSPLALATHIKTPNDFAELLYDNNEEAIHILHAPNHAIGKRFRGMLWEFSPQHFWVNDPKYVLFHEHLQDDMNGILNEIDHPQVEIIKTNKSPNTPEMFGDKGRELIERFYRLDFKLRERYDFKTRLH